MTAGSGRVLRRATTIALASALLAVPAIAQAAPYTALGDSYSSGVGTRTYYSDGTSCQRSPKAYPVLVAPRLGAQLTFVACSGAKTQDVLNNQLGSLNASTGHVSISIGGNDAGFSSVITQCAKPWPYTCWGDIDNAQNFIRNTLPGRLNNVYTQIRNRAPNAKVAVLGYPRIFKPTDSPCNGASRISRGEAEELNQTADILRDVTRGRALAYGFRFADPIPSFVGHGVCDSQEWINGLSSPTTESYHPNVTGQAQYTNLIEPSLR